MSGQPITPERLAGILKDMESAGAFDSLMLGDHCLTLFAEVERLQARERQLEEYLAASRAAPYGTRLEFDTERIREALGQG